MRQSTNEELSSCACLRRLSGYDGSVRRRHRLLHSLKHGNSFHAAIDAEQNIGVKSSTQNILEPEKDEAVEKVQGHADNEGPVLPLAREIPEQDENRSHETVDDEVERKTGIPGLMSQRVNHLRHA